ncbi:hypothetical protein BH23ACT2_BH23ACT2_28540 [soil metagenome]
MTRTHPFLAVSMSAALLLATASCGDDDADSAEPGGTEAADGGIESLADLSGGRIGVQSGTTGEAYANDNLPDGAEVVSFDDTTGLFGALESDDIDAILQDLPVNAGRVAEDDSTAVVETFATDEQYGFAVAQGSDLKAELDEALATVRDDGTYDALFEKYFPLDGDEPGPGPDETEVEGSEVLNVCSDIPYPPMEMEGDGPRGLEYTGFDIELLDAMAAELDQRLEILAVGFDGILGNLASGTCDVVASSVTITDERLEEVDFTDPYFDADQSLLVKTS